MTLSNWKREVDMGRTRPCPPAISTDDPRLLTCCLAIEPTPKRKGGRGRVCKDTKGHENPLHDWERPKEREKP